MPGPDYSQRPGLVVIFETLKVLSVALRDMGPEAEVAASAYVIAAIVDRLEGLLPREQ